MTLDQAIELWARWVDRGQVGKSGFHSMLHMMMETHCVFSGGGNKPSDGMPNDSVEADIEACLMNIRQSSEITAKVISLEYRRPGQQIDKARILGLTLRTYRNHLRKGKLTLLRYLAERRGGEWLMRFKLSSNKNRI